MMVDLSQLLLIILYFLLVLLVIIFIILGIKLIMTLKKVDDIMEDINKKMNKVDGVFNIIDKTTDYAYSVGDKITSLISNFLKKKKGNDEDE